VTDVLSYQLQAAATEELGSVTGQVFDFVRVFFVLLGVLLLAYVVVRHWLPRLSGFRVSGTSPIQILCRTGLEPKKNLYLLKVGTEVLLVGTAENHIHLLKSLDTKNAASLLESLPSAPQREDGRFLNLLSDLRKGNLPNSGK